MLKVFLLMSLWAKINGYLWVDITPKKKKISYYLSNVSKVIDGNYDNIILLGDFNVATSEDIMNDFCQMY